MIPRSRRLAVHASGAAYLRSIEAGPGLAVRRAPCRDMVGVAVAEAMPSSVVTALGHHGSVTNPLPELEELLRSRQADGPEGSYSAALFADPELIQRKIMEEAFETCLELGRGTEGNERVASEAADLVFHLLVGLVGADVRFQEVLDELARRARPSGGERDARPSGGERDARPSGGERDARPSGGERGDRP